MKRLRSQPLANPEKFFRVLINSTKRKTNLPEIKATLRPYQKQGVTWLDYLHKQKLGGCLADDMGLGKTLQTIAILAKVYPKQKKPTLVIMPKTLVFNWENEVKRFAPRTYRLYLLRKYPGHEAKH